MITKGTKLVIRPEWQDPGDDQMVFIAIDDEEKGRVTIMNPLSSLKIIPTQVVRVDMVEIYKGV